MYTLTVCKQSSTAAIHTAWSRSKAWSVLQLLLHETNVVIFDHHVGVPDAKLFLFIIEIVLRVYSSTYASSKTSFLYARILISCPAFMLTKICTLTRPLDVSRSEKKHQEARLHVVNCVIESGTFRLHWKHCHCIEFGPCSSAQNKTPHESSNHTLDALISCVQLRSVM